MINLFPAILLAGPPHSGKSVLAYLLTQELVKQRLAHYLLRAVPDGEGNWFHTGKPQTVRTLRMDLKHGYTDAFINHMTDVVERRSAPLLVDIGGLPRGKQFDILRACTHLILLYRSERERQQWLENLAVEQVHLISVAELLSNQNQQDCVEATYPALKGQISGLEREEALRKTGPAFAALAELVKGICAYDETDLMRVHLPQSPYLVTDEHTLARQIGISQLGQMVTWKPSHLAELDALIPQGVPAALYGRGPVWLAAYAAARAAPARFALFDIRYGWIKTEPIQNLKTARLDEAFNVTISPWQDGVWLRIQLGNGLLEPGELALPGMRSKKGVVLDGALPRWAYAALAYHFAAKQRMWIGVRDARLNCVVVVYSSAPHIKIGETISLPDQD